MTENQPSINPSSTSRTLDKVVDDSKRIAEDVQQLYSTIKHENPFGQIYQENPYAFIGAAVGVGYILGGGLFTPFTRRVLRIGMKALVIPMATSQLKNGSLSDR